MDKRISLDLQFFSEKTEKATPQKKQEARKKGQVAKSTDLTNAIILLFSLIVLLVYGKQMASYLLILFRQGLSDMLVWNVTQDSIPLLFTMLLKESIIIVGPILFIAWLAALAANLLQVGFLVTGEPLKLDLKKIDPIQGAKRLFSTRTLVELIKSLIKVIVISYVAGLLLWRNKNQILQFPEMEPLTIISIIASLMINIGIVISIVYFVIAIADFLYQKYEHAKQLRMSKQDIKDEHKKTEGDPLIKHKIKEKQRQMAMSRMMQDVPKAQVVVTNPTHYAVAIAYDSGEMQVPVVVAKGTDFLALKIREVAKEHRVIIMENKPLARALYANVEVGQEIPEDLFRAVAEVLAYVYRIKGTLSK